MIRRTAARPSRRGGSRPPGPLPVFSAPAFGNKAFFRKPVDTGTLMIFNRESFIDINLLIE
jgi:hypothetical protein